MLSAHEIDDIVDRLREWLVESNEELENHQIEELAQLTREGASPRVGLLEIAEAFTALRQEIKLHTKSVRVLHDRVEKGLGDLGEASAVLSQTTREVEERGEAQLRQIIESLLDIDEALDQALATWRRSHRDQGECDQRFAELCQREFQQLSRWRRVLMRPWHEKMQQAIKLWQSQSPAPDQSDYAGGLEMLKNKLERILDRVQVARIDGVGKAVDPSQMRIVETVDDQQRQPGTVVEQIRPGYLRNGKVLRHAEVKVVGH